VEGRKAEMPTQLSERDRRRAMVLATLVGNLPKGFWDDLRARVAQVYADVYREVLNDPNILDEQRLTFLYQRRHFRMEHLLLTLAKEHGLSVSANLLIANNQSYVYAAGGVVSFTQHYVAAIGEMPKPARFRERHAAMNNIAAIPMFDFGDQPAALLESKEIYGLIVHNPVGKRFTESDQVLGMIQFGVPNPDCAEWAFELNVHDIAAAYAAARKTKKKDDRGPSWKQKKDEKRGEGK
jgi:hypothetical protein